MDVWDLAMRDCNEVWLIWSNRCASEDKANESLVKSTNPTAPPS